ncbi:MAG: DNA polymerase III subunit [candidate division KSB1 bacterium]|nr:DNA polymerase III subunit [candidate division KSB1 bacterium]MDZ7303431.1 DNA polymerase III subunit [candidate division KSB1 bacterium]MDZ7312513.1 DNA polymerase III subunit [candidate division KSB1 bacterium]
MISIIGQENALEFLRRARQNERVAHAYLFHGPEGTGKEALAVLAAQSFFCEKQRRKPTQPATIALFEEPAATPMVRTDGRPDLACGVCSACRRVAEMTHPDVRVLFPRPASASEEERTEVLRSLAANPYQRLRPWENPTILIDDVRSLKRDLAMTSYEGQGMAALILEADRMKAEAANALLKILEEPPPQTLLILTATSVGGLLPTIVSRCQTVQLLILSLEQIASALQEKHRVPAARAQFIAKLANGNFRRALELLDDDVDARRQQAVEFLRMAFRFNKPVEQMDFLNTLVRDHDRRELRQLLEFCTLWIRDGYVLKLMPQGNTSIINTDLERMLADLVKNLPHFDFPGVIAELEFAIECLDRYVQPWLVLMVLLHRIQQLAGSRLRL